MEKCSVYVLPFLCATEMRAKETKIHELQCYEVFNSMKRITAHTEFDYNVRFEICWFLEECLRHCLLVNEHSYKYTHVSSPSCNGIYNYERVVD